VISDGEGDDFGTRNLNSDWKLEIVLGNLTFATIEYCQAYDPRALKPNTGPFNVEWPTDRVRLGTEYGLVGE
jgi:hypothetical protein